MVHEKYQIVTLLPQEEWLNVHGDVRVVFTLKGMEELRGNYSLGHLEAYLKLHHFDSREDITPEGALTYKNCHNRREFILHPHHIQELCESESLFAFFEKHGLDLYLESRMYDAGYIYPDNPAIWRKFAFEKETMNN